MMVRISSANCLLVRATQVSIDHASELNQDFRKACGGVVRGEWYQSSELDTKNEAFFCIVQRCLTGIDCLELVICAFQFCLISCLEGISVVNCLLTLVLSTVKLSGVLTRGWCCRG
jgi:hypothetical protein